MSSSMTASPQVALRTEESLKQRSPGAALLFMALFAAGCEPSSSAVPTADAAPRATPDISRAGDLKPLPSADQEPPPPPPGVVLVLARSALEPAAEKVARQKNWRILKVTTQADRLATARHVRQVIAQEYRAASFDYLLILGTDEQIPMVDHNRELFPEDASSPTVLDALYYGNMDQDTFVELAVGRLPFDDPALISAYFMDLQIMGQDVFFSLATNAGLNRCTCDLEGTELDCDPCNVDQRCLSELFEGIELMKEPRQEWITSALRSAKLFVHRSHGNKDLLCLGSATVQCSSFYRSADLPNLHQNRPIIVADACLTAQTFGPEAIKRGAAAFVGSYPEGALRGGLQLVNALLSQEAVGKAFKRQLNMNIAEASARKDNMWSVASLSASSQHTITGFTYVVYGDPSVKMPGASTQLAENVTLTEQGSTAMVRIQPPERRSSGDVEMACYGSAAIRNSSFAADQYARTTGSKAITLGFASTLDQLHSAAVFVGGQAVDLRQLRVQDTLPVVALVRGDTEAFLVLQLEINEFEQEIRVCLNQQDCQP